MRPPWGANGPPSRAFAKKDEKREEQKRKGHPRFSCTMNKYIEEKEGKGTL